MVAETQTLQYVRIGRYHARKFNETDDKDFYELRADASGVKVVGAIEIYSENNPGEVISIALAMRRGYFRRIFQIEDCCVDIQDMKNCRSFLTVSNKDPEKRQEALRQLDMMLR